MTPQHLAGTLLDTIAVMPLALISRSPQLSDNTTSLKLSTLTFGVDTASSL
jgi:hypothetical protein